MNIIQLLYMDTNLNNITKMYDKLTYFDQYGGSLVLFIVITIVVILLVSYFQTMANIQPIIDDWPNQRCKPTIMPFAGLITHPEGVTASEYTSQNFNYCTQNILSNITGYAVEPLTYVTNVLQNLANTIQNSIQSVRAMFDKVRTSMQTVSEEIMGRLMNVMAPLMQIIISFKDLTSKIQGTMTAGLYTLLGSYFTLKSLMGAIAQFIIGILISLAVMVAVFWILPFTWGAAIANTAIFVAIAIPMAIILNFMTNVLHVNDGYKIPKIKCFDKDTLITMNDGTLKKIIDIETGDILSNNNVVTAKIKVTTEGSDIYELDNIIVSDSHIVKYGNIWIPVSSHPDAVKCESYNEPFLYCLNTTHKIIKIDNQIFTDWDEIYDETLNQVLNNKIIPIKCRKDIHKYLDCGFAKSTRVKLLNGTYKDINKIDINDVLENGEIVYGVVEIDGLGMAQNCVYNLGENSIVEGYITELHMYKQSISVSNQKLYHLLTDKKTLKLGNVIFKDYNDTIDRFLEIYF
jgi:hypothetical protein